MNSDILPLPPGGRESPPQGLPLAHQGTVTFILLVVYYSFKGGSRDVTLYRARLATSTLDPQNLIFRVGLTIPRVRFTNFKVGNKKKRV